MYLKFYVSRDSFEFLFMANMKVYRYILCFKTDVFKGGCFWSAPRLKSRLRH